jgi:hypothetical protein
MDSLLLTRQAFGQLFLGNERERERERDGKARFEL